MICVCGEPLEENQRAIYVLERENDIELGWTCCHQPIGDAVILGSKYCAHQWLLTHPQCRAAMEALVAHG